MAHTIRAIVMGGLGNQMFIYATARALALRTGGRLVLDVSRFARDHDYGRVFLLDRFPVSGEVLRPGLVGRAALLMERVIRKNETLTRWADIIVDPYFAGRPRVMTELVTSPPRRSVTLDGFWQSEQYFHDHAAVVRQELCPPVPTCPLALRELEAIKSSANAVAVAIRFYREVPGSAVDAEAVIAPFRRCLAEYAAGHPEATYFVFTEEPGFFQSPQCLGVPFTLITPRPRNEDAPVDLHLLAHCTTFFLGYSSFHWWGAWLGTAPGKAVHYLHTPGRPCRDYVPADWKVVTVQ